VKGSERGQAITTTIASPGKESGLLPVPRLLYGKVQAEHASTLMTKREEKEGERCLSLAQAGLSNYLCSNVPCVKSVYVRGGIHTATIYPLYIGK
jgi:hypothetical protein